MVVQSVSGIPSLLDDGSKEVTVVLFYESSSEECEHMNRILELLSPRRDFRNINFKKCSIQDCRDIFANFKVDEVPTFLFFQKGIQVDKVIGADPSSLNIKLQKYIKPSFTESYPDSSAVKSNSIVAVIDECGDSESNEDLLNILKESKIKFDTLNVASDNSLKKKLINHSESSSFPQLYIKGDFIGDLETVKKFKASGELSVWVEAAGKNLDEPLAERILFLIKKSKVMVFMKGDREAPRCGFSRQLMEILKETKIPFETFDILMDEEVRQGLKAYISWPTYPQVYVNGEFIGGLDIIRIMKEDGDLISTLNG